MCHKFCSRCSRDETCEVYPFSGHYGRFQFNAFKFLRNLGSVYLQCKILICDSSDHQSRCNQGCVSRRKRDISSYKWKADSVIGPIRLKRDQSASGNSGKEQAISWSKNTSWFIKFCSIVFLLKHAQCRDLWHQQLSPNKHTRLIFLLVEKM